MKKANETRDKLISDFTENYMGKLFYFCLKKAGSTSEAEDLAQDIALQVITALNKGTEPSNFSAWVWQIARNRYAALAKEKHDLRESLTGHDIGDYDIPDGRIDHLDEMIHTEQMSLLRRELAFIKSDYRNVLVAYYIEDKSVREIADILSLSVNTVKSKLLRARQILKEGMNMAREFGKRSYKPENISFINNGLFGANGEPWNYISRSLCKNILLAAYRSPSTAEELAMEVGVALPYMEEELSSLVSATLMKKNGNKYETNFFIVSAGAQERIFADLRAIAPELMKAVIDVVEYKLDWYNKNVPDWHDGYQSLDDMRWALLMLETDRINFDVLKPFNKDASSVPNIGPWGHTIRPNGGEWDILGMESHHGDEPDFVGLYGCVSSPNERDLPEIMFRQYKFKYCGLEKRTPDVLSYVDGQGLVAVANGCVATVDESVLRRLELHGYIKKTQAGYVPTILVMRKDKERAMPPEEHRQLESIKNRARDIATQHYLLCREQIFREIPEFLKENEFQIDHACANIFALRGAILEETIKQKYLSFDVNNDKQMLGAYLVL